MRRGEAPGARAGLPALLLLAVVAVNGCAAGHPQPGAAGGKTASPSASGTRVDAIEKIIKRTSNSDDSYVQFNDLSDQSNDRVGPQVQLSCDPTGCIVVVGCDGAGEPRCADIGSKLSPLGFFPRQKTYTLGIPGHDDRGNETLDGSHGSAHDFAVLTERIFLDVLGASRDYKLTWQSAAQQVPVPVPLD